MIRNFLPKFNARRVKPNKIRCRIRMKPVDSKPEEYVRQRVLNWLIGHDKWNPSQIRVEHEYLWVSENRKIFPDIELLDANNKVKLVIECKAENIELSDSAVMQAREYAIKSESKFIWVTNGKEHRFAEKVNSEWRFTDTLKLLNIKTSWQSTPPAYPKSLDEKSVKSYLKKHHWLDYTSELPHAPTRDVLMAFHKLFYDMKIDPKNDLPFSYRGVQILEDCGPMYMASGNASGGVYSGWYRGFVTRTSDHLDLLTLGITFNDGSKNEEVKGAQLCIDRLTRKQNTHALQFSLIDEHCTLHDSGMYWDVTHDGSKGGKNQNIPKVMEVIRESEAEHLTYQCGEKKRIRLGKLYPATDCCWANSKELIANFLHYGMIRYRPGLMSKKDSKK